MKFIKEVLKGIIIGIANIIPGVSGGTLAVSMGIYDTLIHSVTHIFKEPKKSIKALVPFGIGAVFGIGLLSFVIDFLFTHYPFPTTLCFIGLIVGGLPIINNRIKGEKKGIQHILAFVLLAGVVIIMPFLVGNERTDVIMTLNMMMMLKLFGVGIIAAATMVIPGVSGSMMLMLLGFYQPILSLVKNFIQETLKLNFEEMYHIGIFLVPFTLGVAIGIILVAKLVEWLLEKHSTLTFCGILGLIIASPVAIIYEMNFTTIMPSTIIISIVTFIIGFVVAFKLAAEE